MNSAAAPAPPPGTHCVGPESPEAGLAPGCAGCPNASLCASGAARQPDPDLPLIHARLSGIRHILLVMSGKGGVGKSSVSKELAFALADRGFRVGLLDADLCGPSLPRLAGGRREDMHRTSTGMEPVWLRPHLALVSSHYLLDAQEKNEALLLRGPRKNAMLKLFLKDVEWGELDVLLIDTPPGTSDEHLTLANLLKPTETRATAATGSSDDNSNAPPRQPPSVVMVTTPQRVAEADVRREMTFCAKAKLPVLGLVENMSGFVCPNCHNRGMRRGDAIGNIRTAVPSSSSLSSRKNTAGERLSAEFGVPLLGRIPMDPSLMKACENGVSLMDYLMALAEKEEEEERVASEEGKGEAAAVAAADKSTEAVEAIYSIVDRVIEMLGATPSFAEE